MANKQGKRKRGKILHNPLASFSSTFLFKFLFFFFFPLSPSNPFLSQFIRYLFYTDFCSSSLNSGIPPNTFFKNLFLFLTKFYSSTCSSVSLSLSPNKIVSFKRCWMGVTENDYKKSTKYL